jgi:hypothetical protein
LLMLIVFFRGMTGNMWSISPAPTPTSLSVR